MIKDIEMRLVALIEENYNSTNDKDFKVINFLPDIKVKKVIEQGVHKCENGIYYFEVDKEKDTFQIPYTKNIKDLSVIVGENGSGKTTLINQIFNKRFNRSTENSRVHLVFEQKDNFWLYPKSLPETLSIQADNKYPLIIKFSNATEFLTNFSSGVLNKVDASSFSNIFTYGKLTEEVKNEKIADLQEMLNQLKFINEFKEKIKRFVDYTQKGVEIDIEGSYLPCDSKQLVCMDEVELLKRSDREKVSINQKVINYFSVLINCMLDIDYNGRFSKNYERLLNFHLSFWERTSDSEMNYQSVQVKFSNFNLNSSITDIRLRNIIFGKENSNEFIICLLKIWHIMFIFHLYITYLKTLGEEEEINNRYFDKIHTVLEYFKELTNTISPIIKQYGLFREYMNIDDVIFYSHSFFTNKVNINNVKKWESIWRRNSKICINVAREIRYTFYFDLLDSSDLMKYKLVQDRVWRDLTNFGRLDKYTKNLQEIVTILYNLPEITTNFDYLSSFVNCVSEIKISEVLQCVKLRWIGLSSGELGLLKSFTNLYSAKIALQKKMLPGVDKDNYLLLLDEVDLGLHPEWQRKWISRALPIIDKIFDDKHVQIIITSHSPIFLSDIYKENIIFLTTENNEKSNEKTIEKTIEKTFGQNIYTLFKNSFFLNDVMGEYAFNTIKDTIEYLSFKVNSNSSYSRAESLYNNSDEIINEKIAKKVIDSVGEPIIANQLKELFYKAFPNKNDEISEIQNQINQLQIKLRQLEEEHSQ